MSLNISEGCIRLHHPISRLEAFPKITKTSRKSIKNLSGFNDFHFSKKNSNVDLPGKTKFWYFLRSRKSFKLFRIGDSMGQNLKQSKSFLHLALNICLQYFMLRYTSLCKDSTCFFQVRFSVTCFVYQHLRINFLSIIVRPLSASLAN